MTDVEVHKSPNDKRLYKRILLPNGLRCLLIHDPEIYQTSPSSEDSSEDDGVMSDGTNESEDNVKSKKAAAAMAVGIGNFSDPKQLQGLAHYLEHMLFMGSEKFPTENEYDDYLQQNGGFCNAYTDLAQTVFLFDVKPSALYGALDRFSAFFIAPLCLEDSMDREVMAVDSEFSISLQDDDWRSHIIFHQTAKPDSVYNRFPMGNRKSLKENPEKEGLQIRDKLFEFYRGHYSAERMSLAVLGGESLPQLESWIHDLFSSISQGLGIAPSFSEQTFPFEGQFLYLMPSVKQLREATITFQLPTLHGEYKKKSEHYISHLLGHEGAGSLLSELKLRGWATELSAGIDDSNFSANSFVYIFQITITLTEAGLKESPGFGLAPIALVFKYLELMKSSIPQEWIYEEMKSVQQVRLRFLEEEDASNYVTKLASDMLHTQAGDEVVCDYLFDGLDAKKVTELLDLMHPKADGMRVDLQITDYESLVQQLKQNKGSFEHVEDCWESWYEIPYMKCKFSAFHFNFFSKFPPCGNLHLPQVNPYIPTSFKVLCEDNGHLSEDPSDKPDLLLDINGLRIWHKIDALHKTPKTLATFLLSGPNCHEGNRSLWKATPAKAAALQLLIDIFEDVMNEECYIAGLASLYFFIGQESTGIMFQFNGFSEKLPLLVKKVFQTFANLKVDVKVFENMHEALMNKLKNANKKVRKQTDNTRLYTIIPSQWHFNEILEALHTLTPQDVQDHLALILKECHLEALIYGNLKASEALDLSKGIREELGPGCLKASDRRLLQCAKLQRDDHLLKVATDNPQEDNSGIQIYFQCGQNEIYSRCKLDVIGQICDEPCFDQLRSQEQLGYLVHSRVCLTHDVLGFSISVISERFPPNHVNKRIEAFLDRLEKTLMEMKEEDFETQKAAVIEEKLLKDKNIGETSAKLWTHIVSRQYDFDAKKKEVQIIRKMTKQDIVDYYGAFLSPNSTSRRVLFVNVVSPSHEEENSATDDDSKESIKNLKDFRESIELHAEALDTLL